MARNMLVVLYLNELNFVSLGGSLLCSIGRPASVDTTSRDPTSSSGPPVKVKQNIFNILVSIK